MPQLHDQYISIIWFVGIIFSESSLDTRPGGPFHSHVVFESRSLVAVRKRMKKIYLLTFESPSYFPQGRRGQPDKADMVSSHCTTLCHEVIISLDMQFRQFPAAGSTDNRPA